VEGPTDDPAVLDIRARRTRSMLVTLLLSQGVPMLLGGDEIGRTQRGNNNAYNQDNELSWFDWEAADFDLSGFVGRLTRLRSEHPTFRRTAWLHEHAAEGHDLVGWFTSDGHEMSVDDWNEPAGHSVALHLAGTVVHCERGTVTDDDVLLLFNGSMDARTFHLPESIGADGWAVVVDSVDPHREGGADDEMTVGAFGATVLLRPSRRD
jgi:glycogen operon protein